MKRRLELCKLCRKMSPCPSLENEVPYYVCDAMYHLTSPSGFFLFSEQPMSEKRWMQTDVPKNCDFYAEYFLKECNK